MADRVRPLSDNQRHVLEVLAKGGHIVYLSGIRGKMIARRLFDKDNVYVGDVIPSVMSSLSNPGAYFSGREDPQLIEPYRPRDNHGYRLAHFYRISKKGRAALKIKAPVKPVKASK